MPVLSDRLRKGLKAVGSLVARLLGPRYSRGVLNYWATVVNSEKQVFVTYHMRPRSSTSIRTRSDKVRNAPRLAIIIQGPIIQEDAFTLETVSLYRRHFPDSQLILSTWSDEPMDATKPLVDAGVEVLLNERPEYAGERNINLQIVSSRAGVQRAKDWGAEYALKTRTDQRIYAPNAADFLVNLTHVFPPSSAYPMQKKRIVGVSLNTFKYRMYGMSDMLIFGHIEDMILFWNADLDRRDFSAEERRTGSATLRSFASMRVCEVYLCTEFLRKIGRNVEWSLGDSWNAFADHLCVIDKEQLDLYWPKYQNAEYRHLRYNEQFNVFEEFTFREWLNIYANLANKDIPEAALDQPFFVVRS